MKFPTIFLVVIILFFSLTRLYKINNIPNSVYWDEASIGYNAYSILKTGHDEWGKAFPIHFRAFGEFKLPVYIYSVVITESLFGFNNFAVRLPAVFYALGSIILTYFLAFLIFKKQEVGLIAAFLLSISPWFFIFSRTGYEAMAGLMFYLLGIYLFLLSNKNKLLMLLSICSFILTLYSYNGFRIISPITILFLFVVYFFHNRQQWKKYIFLSFISILLLILSTIPIFRLYLLDQGSARLQAVGITNKSEIIKNYLVHFAPNFLFIKGDNNLRSQQFNQGQLYWLDLIFIILGSLIIFKTKKVVFLLPIIFALIGPIPATLTKETPHALRSISALPFMMMIAAFGIVYLNSKFKTPFVVYGVVLVVYLLYFTNYFNNFLQQYPTYSASAWQYGYSQIFKNYQNEFAEFDKVIISDAGAQPYIFALYYLKYDPTKFINEVEYNSVDKWGFSTVKSFNNLIFEKINSENLPEGKLEIFAAPTEKLINLKEKNVILNLDKSIAFYVYEYEKKN